MSDGGETVPRASVQSLLKKYLPSSLRCTAESRESFVQCCTEFVHLVSAQANEICIRNKRQTISAVDIFNSLSDLDFQHFVDEVKSVYEAAKGVSSFHNKLKRKRRNVHAASGMSEEELLREQQRLYEEAVTKQRVHEDVAHAEKLLQSDHEDNIREDSFD